MPRRHPIGSPYELKKWILRREVTDHNFRVHGVVVESEVRAGTCYAIVDFEDDRRVELKVIDNRDEPPLTPHFIRVRDPEPFGRQAGWFHWRKPDDLPEPDEDPSGDVTVAVTVRTPERASSVRQEQAAWYFAEVLGDAIDDVLEEALSPEKPADEPSGYVQTRAEAERQDTPSVFAVNVNVLLFVDDETALDLLAKLYFLLDSERNDARDLWQDLLAAEGVKDASASAFTVCGQVAGQEIPPARIRLRYFPPRADEAAPDPSSELTDL